MSSGSERQGRGAPNADAVRVRPERVGPEAPITSTGGVLVQDKVFVGAASMRPGDLIPDRPREAVGAVGEGPGRVARADAAPQRPRPPGQSKTGERGRAVAANGEGKPPTGERPVPSEGEPGDKRAAAVRVLNELGVDGEEVVAKIEDRVAHMRRLEAVLTSHNPFDKNLPENRRVDFSFAGEEEAAVMTEAHTTKKPVIKTSDEGYGFDSDFLDVFVDVREAMYQRTLEIGAVNLPPKTSPAAEGETIHADAAEPSTQPAQKAQRPEGKVTILNQVLLQEDRETRAREEAEGQDYLPDPTSLEAHLADLQQWATELPTIQTAEVMKAMLDKGINDLRAYGRSILSPHLRRRVTLPPEVDSTEHIDILRDYLQGVNKLEDFMRIVRDDGGTAHKNVTSIAYNMGHSLVYIQMHALQDQIYALQREPIQRRVLEDQEFRAIALQAEEFLFEQLDSVMEASGNFDPELMAHGDNAEITDRMRARRLSALVGYYEQEQTRAASEALSKDITLADRVFKGGHELKAPDGEIDPKELARRLKAIPGTDGERKKLLQQEEAGLLVALVTGGEETFDRVSRTVARLQAKDTEDAVLDSLKTPRGGAIQKIRRVPFEQITDHLREIIENAGDGSPLRELVTAEQLESAKAILDRYAQAQQKARTGEVKTTVAGDRADGTTAEKASSREVLTSERIAEILAAPIEGDTTGELAEQRAALVRVLGDEAVVAQLEQSRIVMQSFATLFRSDNPLGGQVPTKVDFSFLGEADATAMRAFLADGKAIPLVVEQDGWYLDPSIHELAQTAIVGVLDRLRNIDHNRVAAEEMLRDEGQDFNALADSVGKTAMPLDASNLETIYQMMQDIARQFPSASTIDAINEIHRRTINGLRRRIGARADKESIDRVIDDQQGHISFNEETKASMTGVREAGKQVHTHFKRIAGVMGSAAFNQFQDALHPALIQLETTAAIRQQVQEEARRGATADSDILAAEKYLFYVIKNALEFGNEINPGFKGLEGVADRWIFIQENSLAKAAQEAYLEMMAEQSKKLGNDISLTNNTMRGGGDLRTSGRSREVEAANGRVKIEELSHQLRGIPADIRGSTKLLTTEQAGLLVALVTGGENYLTRIQQTIERIQSTAQVDEQMAYLESEAGERGPTIRKLRSSVNLDTVAKGLLAELMNPANANSFAAFLGEHQIADAQALLEQYVAQRRAEGTTVYPPRKEPPAQPGPADVEIVDESGEPANGDGREKVKLQRVPPGDLRLLQILLENLDVQIAGDVTKVGVVREAMELKRLTFSALEPDTPWGENEQFREIVPDETTDMDTLAKRLRARLTKGEQTRLDSGEARFVIDRIDWFFNQKERISDMRFFQSKRSFLGGSYLVGVGTYEGHKVVVLENPMTKNATYIILEEMLEARQTIASTWEEVAALHDKKSVRGNNLAIKVVHVPVQVEPHDAQNYERRVMENHDGRVWESVDVVLSDIREAEAAREENGEAAQANL